MKKRVTVRRIIIDLLFKVFSTISAFLAFFVLFLILYQVLLIGGKAINFDFFIRLPKPPGEEGGGILNAIIGSFIITFMASLMGVPLGILSGIYCSEFGRGTKYSSLLKFSTEVLSSVPSIIIGLFVYTFLVLPMKRFSAFAGSIALALIIIPLIHRVTEEMLNMVPDSLREAGLALGAEYNLVVRKICLKSAKMGIITGILTALARIAGETAPLLFTSLNSPFLSFNIFKPMATVNVTVFNYAMSPYEDWVRIAWGASFLITVSILILTIFTRIIFKRTRHE